MTRLADTEDEIATFVSRQPAAIALFGGAVVGRQTVDGSRPYPRRQRMRAFDPDHPAEKLVPLAARHALPSDMFDGVAGGAVEVNGLAPWSPGQLLEALRHLRLLSLATGADSSFWAASAAGANTPLHR